jgi:hypothetical protein
VDDRDVEITRPNGSGFDRGAIYEFIYRARGPIVVGSASPRSAISYATRDNPLAPTDQPGLRHTLGFGIAQSGRVLRDLVHLGFNEDS